MSTSTQGSYIALMVPGFLRPIERRMLRQAQDQEPKLVRGWRSIRQANLLGEVAAQASSIAEIQAFLTEQGKRKDEPEDIRTLREQISKDIGESLRREVERAYSTANKKVNDTLQSQWASTAIDSEELAQAHLALARLYINALVALRRIASQKEL